MPAAILAFPSTSRSSPDIAELRAAFLNDAEQRRRVRATTLRSEYSDLLLARELAGSLDTHPPRPGACAPQLRRAIGHHQPAYRR